MPIESVSRVLGHTNIVTTQLYAKITTQKLDNDLTMFGDKLSKTFNGIGGTVRSNCSDTSFCHQKHL